MTSATDEPIDEFFFGRLILQLRTERKITQRRLSQLCGVNRATLRAIEECRTSGSVFDIQRLLNRLGYDLDAYLIESAPRRNRPSDEEQARIDNERQDNNIDTILNFIIKR